MLKANKHIVVVRSGKPWLNSLSQKSSDAICAVLAKHYAKVGEAVVNDLSDLEALVARKPDLVFLGMKFVPSDSELGEQSPSKIWVTDYLDEQGIAYTGSSQIAHEIELDKSLAKQRVLEAGIDVPAFQVIKQTQTSIPDDLSIKFPVFIKPNNRGGGQGVDSASVVNNLHELRIKVDSITSQHASDSLLEEYLPGREFSVAILKDENSLSFFVMPLELIAEPNERGARLLSKEVKSSNSERAVAILDEEIKSSVGKLALDVFYAIGARDYGRIDIRLDRFGAPHFLEANLLPSLIAGYGSFPKACVLNINLGYEAMILSIVSLALNRSLQDEEDKFTVELPALKAVLETI